MGRKYEMRVIELTDEELRREIHKLEATYGMTSEQLPLRYNSGELGDERSTFRRRGAPMG